METFHLNREGRGNPEMSRGNVLNVKQIVRYSWMFAVLTEKYNKQETSRKLIELSAETEEGILGYVTAISWND
jgi:hypothetical protein